MALHGKMGLSSLRIVIASPCKFSYYLCFVSEDSLGSILDVCEQQRLWSDWENAQAGLSLCCALMRSTPVLRVTTHLCCAIWKRA